MTSIHQVHDGLIELTIDTSIYDNWVIEKVLYWWTKDFIVTRENEKGTHIQKITLQLKDGHEYIGFTELKERISNDFIDFKNRQTIAVETANIRDLLFAKAFANNDDFVEFSFKD